ncbi:MAG TPA: hypothetical protein VFS10_03740 [Pyrinomonadaceae bacterium]|nr:hypothetical protein [Pyrinomonadaceae bacterium]
MGSDAVKDFKEGAAPAALWAGVLAGPLAALTQLQVNYALVLWACGAGREWALHLVALLALVVTVGAGLLSGRNWRRAGGSWEDEGAGIIPRSSFMAAVGVLISVLTALVVVAQWLPIFVYGPCER